MSSTARPLLSASLIVKDEEAMLPRCLAALEGVVDEVVVLDTGSSDRTVEIAEAAGAVVVRSGWYDDFGRSRNESLSHCTGRWVIFIDADEELQVDDVEAFRRSLARTTADAFTVHIDNVEDHGGAIAFTHDPTRLFRRTRFTFEGRIHEHVVPRNRQGVDVRRSEGIAIRHYGYIPDVLLAKDKVARNLRLAEAAWEAAPDDVLARTELVRALSSTDRYDDAMGHIRALLDVDGLPRHTALNFGLKVLRNAGRLEEAAAWAEQVRDAGATTAESTKLHAEVLAELGRHAEALQVLQDAPADADVGVHGTHQTATGTEVLRARLLRKVGREDDAVDLMVAIAPHAPDSLWPDMVTALHGRGELHRGARAFLDGLEALGQTRARGVLAALSRCEVQVGHAFFEALAAEPGGLPYSLAFALANAERLTTDQATAWSSVARAADLADNCPLLAQSAAVLLPAMQRLLAAATLVGTFHDERGRAGIRQASALLEDDEVVEALYVLSELAPDALIDLVEGYAISQRRVLVTARALVSLGAPAEAAVVLQHGLESCPPDPFSEDAIAEALSDLGAVA